MQQQSLAESRMNQNFLGASVRTQQHQKTSKYVLRCGHANFVYFRAKPPRRPVVRRPLLLLAVVVGHVHHCPRPHALFRPCPLALAGLALALGPSSALACVPLAPRRCRRRQPLSPPSTTTIAAAAHLTTMTARSQRSLFVIYSGYGGHF